MLGATAQLGRATDAGSRRALGHSPDLVLLVHVHQHGDGECPRCEARDGRRWRAWLGAQLPGALALGALAGLVVALGSFVLRPEPDGWPLLLGLAAWPLAAAGVLGARVSRKRRRATTLRWR